MKATLIAILGLVGANASAATYYVATYGSNASGDGSISRPWATPEFGASRLTSDGDVLYIREGAYNIVTPTGNRSTAIYPRADNCMIAAYPGETVVLRGRSGSFPTGGVIGAVGGRGGLVIDRLVIEGMVMFDGNARGSRPSVLQNSDVSVGGDGWSGTNQGAVVWMDDAVNVQISNNRIHDNGQGSEAGTPANNGLFMIYECTDCVIERNTIYGSSGTGITMKDDVQNVDIRYNWIRDNSASGVWTGNNTAVDVARSASIYQNIFTGNNTSNNPEHGGIALVVQTSLVNIFNNVFHRNYGSDVVQWPSASAADAVAFTYFNNISYYARGYSLSWPYSGSTFAAQYINFNDYFGGAQGWRYRSTTWVPTSIANWRTGISPVLTNTDASSVSTDPGFLNESGTWSTPSDYKRASYLANGRGGAYASVMGAYVTGLEQIGFSGDFQAAPASPSGVTVE